MSQPLDSHDPTVFGITADDPFGLETASSGKLQLQSYGAPEGSNPVMVPDKEGESIASSTKLIDKKVSISATYQAVDLGSLGNIVINAFYGTNREIAVDTATITAQSGQHLTISISGHMHVGGSRTGHNATGARSVTISGLTGFGAQYLTAYCGIPAAALQTGTLQIQFTHKDEPNNEGNFLCGTTHGVVITANYQAIDPEHWDISTLTADNWVATSIPTTSVGSGSTSYGDQTTTTHQSRSLTVVKYFGKNGNSRDVSITATQASSSGSSGT